MIDGFVARAASRLKYGDPEAALVLLESSLEYLLERAVHLPEDVRIRRQLADTMHLLACLPLNRHWRRPQITIRTIDLAIKHAEAALEMYLDLRSETGQKAVFGTLARLCDLKICLKAQSATKRR